MDNGTNDEQLLLTNAITNPGLAKISVIILLFTVAGFVISEALQFLFHVVYFSISVIAVLGATTLYAFSRERRELMYNVNYSVFSIFCCNVCIYFCTMDLWLNS
jgi:Na+/H+ antiporter NhaD/arsenite permease-like protein